MKAKSRILEIFFLAFVLPPMAAVGPELPLHTINLPRGFSISLFAEGVPNARSFSLSPKGTLFVGSR